MEWMLQLEYEKQEMEYAQSPYLIWILQAKLTEAGEGKESIGWNNYGQVF